MGTGNKILAGAAWIYAAQVATVIFQFGYAAIASRFVLPQGFGSYAIAVSVTGLITLVATGGVGSAVSRMPSLDRVRLRALSGYALILGTTAAAFVWFTAQLWALLWNDTAATPVIQLLAVSAFVAPLSGIGTSLMRRHGSFRALAVLVLGSNLVGMLGGALVVMQLRSAVALAVSAVLSQALLLAGTLILTRRDLLGFARLKHARAEVLFSGRLTGVKVAEYLIGAMVKWSVSRAVGATALGYWNRGEVLTFVPFQQVQSAMVQAIAPEFRHDINAPVRAHSVWTDLLVLVAWVAVPSSVLAAVILPYMVPILFGSGWATTASLVPFLAVAAGLQLLSTVLSTAVESLGRFRWMWATSILLLSIQVAGVIGVFVYKDLAVAMVILIVTQVARHTLQVFLCSAHGYLNRRRLVREYVVVMAVSAALGSMAWIVCLILTSPWNWLPAYTLAFVIVVSSASVLWILRTQLPPVILSRKYGLFLRSAGDKGSP